MPPQSVYCGTGVLAGDTVRGCFSCPPTLDYTFAGVDSTACSYGCIATPAAFNKSYSAFTAVNANTTVNGFALSSSTAGVCTYTGLVSVLNFLQYTSYSLAGCTGTATTGTISSRRITIQIQANRLTSVVLQAESGSLIFPVFSWSGSEVSGVAVPNQLTCGSSGTNVLALGGVAASGGTFTPTF